MMGSVVPPRFAAGTGRRPLWMARTLHGDRLRCVHLNHSFLLLKFE